VGAYSCRRTGSAALLAGDADGRTACGPRTPPSIGLRTSNEHWRRRWYYSLDGHTSCAVIAECPRSKRSINERLNDRNHTGETVIRSVGVGGVSASKAGAYAQRQTGRRVARGRSVKLVSNCAIPGPDAATYLEVLAWIARRGRQAGTGRGHALGRRRETGRRNRHTTRFLFPNLAAFTCGLRSTHPLASIDAQSLRDRPSNRPVNFVSTTLVAYALGEGMEHWEDSCATSDGRNRYPDRYPLGSLGRCAKGHIKASLLHDQQRR
jgi:hypothetical protein